jgi:putative transposase
MENARNQSIRRSIRLPGFDYSSPGMYFMTICTAQRRCMLGHIYEDKSVLSQIGEVVRTCWLEIPFHFSNLEMEAFVVMPNHLHGILIVHPGRQNLKSQNEPKEFIEAFGKPVVGSIPTIIRSFKAAVTKRVRDAGLLHDGPVWQRGYFERVLRDSREFINAKDYIIKNPLRWAFDEENPERERPA